MIARLFAALCLFPLLALAALAEADRPGEDLFGTLGLPELLGVMRDEGVDYGVDLGADLFPRRGGATWRDTVEDIYSLDRMSAAVSASLARDLDPAERARILDFFTSRTGARVISLELSARRALLDAEVEAASREMAATAMQDETPLFRLVQDFVETNDLVETNVAGAMNSNVAFYNGLADGGAMPDLTEEEILADVWSQEAAIRSDTEEWLYSFLLMAYRPLSDEELRDYIAFSRSPAGRALNRALFAAFDRMFEDISLSLGLASARYMAGEDI